MLLPDLRRVIAVPMMALRKNRDRVNVPDFKRFLELPFIEVRPDAGNQSAGVKIEMNLAKTQVMHGGDSLDYAGISGASFRISVTFLLRAR
jgi:hypothetical protein